MTCIALGCLNDVVRVMRNDASEFGLCAFHVERAGKYLTDEQYARLVFPQEGTP